VYVIFVAEHASDADAAKLTTALHTPGSLDTEIFAGQVIAGAVLSVDVIVRDAVDVLPQASVNVHDSVYTVPQAAGATVIVPIAEPLISQVPVSPFE
jgi:hypothetical protein